MAVLTVWQRAIVKKNNLVTGIASAVMELTLQKATCTIAFGDWAALANGVKTKDYNVSPVNNVALVDTKLPAKARIICATVETVTAFDDPAHGAFAITIGTSAGGNQIGTSMNVAAGQTGFPKLFTAGAGGFLMCPQASVQLTARMTAGSDLNTATVGTAIVNVFYMDLA